MFVLRDGDIYAALRDCHKALKLDPNHTKAHFRQARCLYELRWFQEALSCLKNFKLKFPEQAEGTAAKTLEKDIRAAAFAETEGGLLDFGAFHGRVSNGAFTIFSGFSEHDPRICS